MAGTRLHLLLLLPTALSPAAAAYAAHPRSRPRRTLPPSPTCGLVQLQVAAKCGSDGLHKRWRGETRR